MDDFYEPNILDTPVLVDDEFKHCIRVLRKKKGDEIGVFDGTGNYLIAKISSISKNHCQLDIIHQKKIPEKPFKINLVIAPTKSMDRMEWMVEKLGELAVDEITFIQAHHSERPKLKTDRLEKKAIAAMKQSKNGYLMRINPLIRFNEFIKVKTLESDGFIAVLQDDTPSFNDSVKPGRPVTILVGPEGDFSQNEISEAFAAGFKAISLGHNVLRTETAGLMACHTVNLINDY